MGFDDNNSDFTQGIDLFSDLFDFSGSSGSETIINASGEHEEIARMTELDAQQAATDAEGDSKKTASQLHKENERERADRNTEWGQSNMAMSGSKELVRESSQITGKNEEEDVIAEGEAEKKQLQNEGRRNANIYRIANGLTPSRSTLSRGSTIYD